MVEVIAPPPPITAAVTSAAHAVDALIVALRVAAVDVVVALLLAEVHVMMRSAPDTVQLSVVAATLFATATQVKSKSLPVEPQVFAVYRTLLSNEYTAHAPVA
jgi:hypothetical protein